MDELTKQLEQLRRSIAPSSMTVEVIMEEHQHRQRRTRVIALSAFAAAAAVVAVAIGVNAAADDRSVPADDTPLLTTTAITRVGGTADDFGGAHVLPDGDLLVVTESSNPSAATTTFGPGGGVDIWVRRLSPDGATTRWTTQIGGASDEILASGVLDSQGRLALAIATPESRTDLPRTPGAYGEVNGGRFSVARVNSDGQVEFVAAIGGTGDVFPNRIAVDGDDNIIVVGATNATDFADTTGTRAESLPQNEAFIIRLSPNGDALTLLNVLGHSTGGDGFTDVAVADDGTIYSAGFSNSTEFPTTAGSAHPTSNFDENAGIVASFDPDSGAVRWASYVNETGFSYVTSLVVADDGDLILAGDTYGEQGGLDVTAGAADTIDPAPGEGAHWVAKMASDGTVVRWASYVTRFDATPDASSAAEVLINDDGAIVVVGDANEPVGGALVEDSPEKRSVFTASISPDGQTLGPISYLGGEADDRVSGIEKGPDGSIVLSVATNSTTWSELPAASARSAGDHGYDVVILNVTPSESP